MAVWNVVTASEIPYDRCDAEFFRDDLSRIINAINAKKDAICLSKIFKTIERGCQPRYTKTGVVRALRSVNVGNLEINNVRQEYVDSEFVYGKKKGIVNKYDLLLTSTGVGTIGRTSIWNSDELSYADGHITIMRDANVNPFTVAAFLITKYGKLQIEKHIRGSSGQIEIYPIDISKILFPKVLVEYQDEIGMEVDVALDMRERADKLLLQAQQLLESELGLDTLDLYKAVSYTTSISKIESAHRFDAEHYYPAFAKLTQNLPQAVNFEPLGPLLSYCQRGKQPSYADSGLPVLNSRHILENKIVSERNRLAAPSVINTFQIQYGDVLINGTGRGTIGRTAPYLVPQLHAIPDNHVTILRSSKLDPAYLSFFLNSLAGKLQVEQHQRGSSGQLELYPFDIRKFYVWVAPQSIQQEIRTLYDNANDAAQKSKQRLSKAKSRVEKLIEQGAQA